jgi:hypothetical protein
MKRRAVRESEREMKTPEIVEKVKELVAPLELAERLRVIRAIQELEPVTKPKTPEKRLDQMLAEQEKWFAQPLGVRERYRNNYIAVQDGQVVDRDESQTALLLRVRKQYSDAPIPILNGNWDEAPVFEFRSPNLEK